MTAYSRWASIGSRGFGKSILSSPNCMVQCHAHHGLNPCNAIIANHRNGRMCGRFTQAMTWQEMHDLYSLSPTVPPTNMEPRYNGAPTQLFAVCRTDIEGAKTLSMLRWGLVPFWSKDKKIASRLINARSETFRSKPSFRAAAKARRCLVPANGWFEWKPTGGRKQPYFISRKDGLPISFAGLWERWQREDEVLETFTILTRDADPQLSNVHHRQPVIMPQALHATWIDPTLPPGDVSELVSSPLTEKFCVRPVGLQVNSVRNNHPGILEDEQPSLL